MSDQVSVTKHCSNCKRDVAEANFIIHEVHCRRNIVLCSKCDEPVPKVQLEEHIEENHALVDCDLCSRLVERSRLSEHKAKLCSKRDKVCSYCSLSVKADEHEEHESYCGTRTEQCVKCQSYIMQKDQAIHDQSDCNLPEHSESASKVDFFGHHHQSGLWNDFRVFSAEHHQPLETEDNEDDYRRMNQRYVDPYADHNFDVHRYHQKNSSSTGESSFGRRGAAFGGIESDSWSNPRPNEQSEDDKVFDEFLKFAAQRKPEAMNGDSEIGNSCHDLNQDVEFFPCEFCDESFPVDVIIQHQTMCGNRFEDPGYNMMRDYGPNLFETMAKAEPIKSTLSASLVRDLTMLPCEFCAEPYPNDELMNHQLSCEVGHFLNNDVSADQAENVKRPPSLPSGLNKIGAHKSISGSTIRSSTSIPTGLSHLKSSSVSTAGKALKPGASFNRPKNLAGTRNLNSRQLPHGERTPNAASANFSSHQPTGSNDARPFRGMQINDFSESPVSNLGTELAGANSSRAGFTTNKPNLTVNHQPVISRQNARDYRHMSLGSPGINPSSSQANSNSRLTSTRLAASGQTDNQHRQEQETGVRRTRAMPTSSNNQRKNPRSSQDQHGSH